MGRSNTKNKTTKKSQRGKKPQKSKAPPKEKVTKNDESQKTQHRGKKRNHKFKIYIGRALKPINTKSQISQSVTRQVNRLCDLLASRIVSSARQECIDKSKKTVTNNEVELAVRLLYPSELASGAIAYGNDSVEKFVTSKSTSSS